MATVKSKSSASGKQPRKAAARSKAAPVPPVVPSGGHDLLEAILAAPRDSRVRLVYADLMQDLGDPRGELIILQCARADVADDDPRAAEMDARAAELLKKHKKAWISRFGEAKGARWEFRRGFVEKVSMDAEALARIGADLFAVEPIEELAIWKLRDHDDDGPPGPSRLGSVLGFPGLARVRRLSLARSHLQPSDVEVLVHAKTLAGVELLDLTACELDSESIAAIAGATSMPNLTELRLGNNFAGDLGAEALAASALRLERLVLVRNDLGAAGASAIAGAAFGATLTHLDLSTNDITSAGLRALAASTALTALRSLKLEYCLLDDDCVDDVLASSALANLEHLDLSSNLSGAAIERLRERFGERLHMRYERH